MESANDGTSGLLDEMVNQLNVIVSYLPSVLTIVLILTLGWIVARLARRLVRKLGMASNQWLIRMFPGGILSGARMSSLVVSLISEILFWAIIFISVTIAARFAELGSVSQWLERITAQLPNLIAGIGIVIVGYFLSVLAREQVPGQTGTERSSANLFVGRIVQAAVLSCALIVGLDQIGIEVTLLIGLAIVAVAGILTAVAVSFALSARTHISNLIGARNAHAHLCVGMTVQVGEYHGEIVELTPTLIALDTNEGRVLLPGKLIDESVILVKNLNSGEESKDD